jgi:hypothetical protein
MARKTTAIVKAREAKAIATSLYTHAVGTVNPSDTVLTIIFADYKFSEEVTNNDRRCHL